MSLNEKDIVIFGKVLSEIGSQIQANPNIFLELIKIKEPIKQPDNVNKLIKQIELKDILSSQNKQLFLDSFTADELKNYIKENHFGVPTKPNKEKLIDCIIRNTDFNSKDVFLDYQTPVEKELKTFDDKNIV